MVWLLPLLLSVSAWAQPLAPPAPARLDPLPARRAAPATAPAAIAFAGLESLPGGRWRVGFAESAATVPGTSVAGLAALGARLAAGPAGRVTLVAFATGPASDGSTARRLALARGLAVKRALMAGGLEPTRIDIRPLGRQPPARVAERGDVPGRAAERGGDTQARAAERGGDAVDISPPGIGPA